MTESTPVSLNLQSPNISTVVYAVQNDRSARHIVAQLCDGSATWTPPADAAPVIRYVKPDGTGGFYDADDNDDPAIVISGSKADMTIVEQALTVTGDVYMQLHFYAADGTRLTSFVWILRVQQSVLNDATIVSSDYFNVLTAKVSEAVQAASAAAESAAAAAASAALISIPLPITSGGTGATTAAGARENIGLENVANERQYSAQNPPPYPVTSVNGETGAVSVYSRTLLWTNPDPATLAAGTVNVNMVGYDHIEIECTETGKPPSRTFFVKCPIGTDITSAETTLTTFFFNRDLTGVNTLGVMSRIARVYLQGIIFESGDMLYDGTYYKNWDNRAVPYRVWGIKY